MKHESHVKSSQREKRTKFQNGQDIDILHELDEDRKRFGETLEKERTSMDAFEKLRANPPLELKLALAGIEPSEKPKTRRLQRLGRHQIDAVKRRNEIITARARLRFIRRTGATVTKEEFKSLAKAGVPKLNFWKWIRTQPKEARRILGNLEMFEERSFSSQIKPTPIVEDPVIQKPQEVLPKRLTAPRGAPKWARPNRERRGSGLVARSHNPSLALRPGQNPLASRPNIRQDALILFNPIIIQKARAKRNRAFPRRRR